MLVSANWLQDFLSEPFTESERAHLGDTLTLHTAEVDAVSERGGHLAQISVALIEAIEPHPEADKLQLATVRINDENAVQRVVCGAPNITVGMKVPYAPLGTSFPNGLTLEPKKIRGVISEGMLCSAAELEVGDDHSGILALPEDAPIGRTMTEHFNVESDLVVDIDNKAITHRPDLWGHMGIARECGALLNKGFKADRFGSEWQAKMDGQMQNDSPSPIGVAVKDGTCCTGYFGLSVDNVKVEPSPQWMQERLLAVGLRPINNLVDIGNYVMLEVGGPVHIFDRTKISGGKIQIRQAEEGEKLLLLDETEALLTPEDTVVADTEKALVVAGIMGGEESGVTENTTEIFIEAATWERTPIRKSSTRIGVRTDSSNRFEKGLDPHLMRTTILRTLELVQELCPGAHVVGRLEYDGENLDELKAPTVPCSVTQINGLLGTHYTQEEIIQTLQGLEFCVSSDDEKMTVSIPSFRATREFTYMADVAEEVGRIRGYGSITPVSPKLPVTPVRRLPVHQIEKKIADFLPLHGRFLEVQTYPLIGEKGLEQTGWKSADPLLLKNPLSVEQDRMRPSLIPLILLAMRENAKHFESFRLFEIGRSYHSATKDGGYAEEQRELCLGIYSENTKVNPFRALVDVMEPLFEHLGVAVQCVETTEKFPHPLIPLDWEGRHPFATRSFNGYGKTLGEATEVHPLLLKSLKIRGRIALGVIALDPIAERVNKVSYPYEPLSRYPSAVFDCTVSVAPRSELEALASVMRRFKDKRVLDRAIVTEYSPSSEERYVTVRFRFGSKSETLSGDDIKSLENKAIAHLEKHGYSLKMG
ncbi:phenylalanine--tRNA ligase subunit beta [bacterium]|nr:phenylalanine--tRNA ligase subunit beta [bacterium]